MSDKLTVIEQEIVTFCEDELTAVLAEDGSLHIHPAALRVDRRGLISPTSAYKS